MDQEPAHRKRSRVESALIPTSTESVHEEEAEEEEQRHNKRREVHCADVENVFEDAPSVAVLRHRLKEDTFAAFVRKTESYGAITGNSKSARTCRSHGAAVGLRAMFARILWTQKLHEDLQSRLPVDTVFPNVQVDDQPVVSELLGLGRTIGQAQD